MKKFCSIASIVLLIAATFLLQGCKNPVEEVFSKDWTTMSKEDKAKLEKYFKSEGYSDSSQYWELCYNEDVDTTGRVNPWKKGSVIEKNSVINLYIDNSSSMKGYFESKNLSPLITVLSGIQQYFSGSNINGYYH